MSNRDDLKKLEANKADRLKVEKGVPSNHEGRNGDLTVRQVRSGLSLFAKFFDKWYRVAKLEDITRDGQKIIGIGEDKTFNSITIKDNITFEKGDKAVILKNNQGTLDVRRHKNQDNTASYQKLSWTGTELSLGGQNDKYITGGTTELGGTGMKLYIRGGDAKAGGANKTGGQLLLQSGQSTGDGTPGYILFQMPVIGTGGATTLNAETSVAYFDNGVTDATNWGDFVLENDLRLKSTTGEETTISVADTSGIFTIATTASTSTDADLVLDAGGDIYINADNGTIAFKDGGTTLGEITNVDGGTLLINGPGLFLGDIKLGSAQKLYFDFGSNTYIEEDPADGLTFHCGGTTLLQLFEGGTSGDKANFGTTGAGFTQGTTTYHVDDTNVEFNLKGNKSFLTFGSGNITDLHLFFPDVSCNCILLVKQDGSGSRLITNYKTWDQASGNESTVIWAGGTNPTLTTTADKLDIMSFYWDNENHKAYGTITQNF